MAAYVIVYRESPVRDAGAMEQYSQRNRENAALFRARYGLAPLAIYGKSEAPEGANPDGVVLLQFPTYQAAKDWYESAEYREAAALRMGSADWRVVILDGLPENPAPQ